MPGRSFELAFGLLLGGSCNFEEATLGVLQDEMEGQGEAVGEAAGDSAANAFASAANDMQLDGAVMVASADMLSSSSSSDEERGDEIRHSEASPQPVWAARSDPSHRAVGVARAQGMLGP